jgi:type IV fimbrial biogenesis protein FimT
MDRGHARRGFSLLEMLVACALLATLAAVSAGSLSSLVATRRLDGIANELARDLHYARTEAVLRNTDMHFAFAVNGAGSCYVIHTGQGKDCSCTPGADASCSADATAVKWVSWPRSAGAWLTRVPAPFMITARLGTVTPTARIPLADARGNEHGIDVVVNQMGRARSCWQGTSIAGLPRCDKPRSGT